MFGDVDWAMCDKYGYYVDSCFVEYHESMGGYVPPARGGQYDDDPYECLARRPRARRRTSTR